MFKEKFKYYKRKVPPPDLSSVLDLSFKPFQEVSLKSPFQLPNLFEIHLNDLGLLPVNQWNIYEINSHPGLLVIKNPFTSDGQKWWIHRTLAVYTKPPNRLNLHNHGELSSAEDWWHICQSDKERKKHIFKNLRWVTMGYHHNWDTKVYTESDKSEFPLELKQLSQIVVKAACNYDLIPQAAIINYYNIGSTLSGHTDHSEPNHEAPLISFSFGQEAVFLIGGSSLEDDCKALLVKSGDIMIMCGNSRLSYHGVPLIMTTESKPWMSDDPSMFNHSWLPYEEYITTSRININVRQVLHHGCKSLPS